MEEATRLFLLELLHGCHVGHRGDTGQVGTAALQAIYRFGLRCESHTPEDLCTAVASLLPQAFATQVGQQPQHTEPTADSCSAAQPDDLAGPATTAPAVTAGRLSRNGEARQAEHLSPECSTSVLPAADQKESVCGQGPSTEAARAVSCHSDKLTASVSGAESQTDSVMLQVFNTAVSLGDPSWLHALPNHKQTVPILLKTLIPAAIQLKEIELLSRLLEACQLWRQYFEWFQLPLTDAQLKAALQIVAALHAQRDLAANQMVTAPLLRLISAALEPRLHPHRPHFDLPAPEVLTAVLSMASSKPTATVVLYILQYCMMYATPAHAAVEGRASVIALHWLRQPPADVLSEPGLVDLWIASVDYLQQYITQRVTTDNATRFEVLKRLGLYPVVLRTCDVAFQLLSCPAEEDPEIGLLAAAIELCGGIGHAARHSPIEAERSLVPFFVRLMEMCFEPASICAEIDYETAEEAVTAFRMILAHPEERRRALSARGGRFVLDLIEWTGNDLKDGEMVTCGLPPLLTCLIQDQQQVPRRMPLLLVGMLADGKNQLARLRLEALDALGGLLCRTGIELPAAVSQRLPKAVPGLLQCIQEAVDQAASQRERQPEGISIRASTGTQGLQKLMEVFPECFEAAVKAGVIQMLTRMAALDVLVSTQAVDVLTWAVGLQPSLGEPLTSPDGLRCILSAVRHAVMVGEPLPTCHLMLLTTLLRELQRLLMETAKTAGTAEAQAALSAFHTPELVAALLGVLRRVVPRAWEDVSDARLLACYMAMGLLCRCTHHLTPANRQMLLGMLVELVTRHNKLPPAQQCCQRGIQLFEDTLGVFVNITAEEDALSREQKDTLVQTVCSLLGALGATTAQRSITKEARTMVEAAVYICCQLHRLQDIERHAQQSKGLCETLRAVSRNILLVRRKQQQAEKAAGGADTEAATAAAEAAMQALLAEEQMAKAQQAAKAAKRQRQKAKAKQKQAAADVQAPSQRCEGSGESAPAGRLSLDGNQEDEPAGPLGSGSLTPQAQVEVDSSSLPAHLPTATLCQRGGSGGQSGSAPIQPQDCDDDDGLPAPSGRGYCTPRAQPEAVSASLRLWSTAAANGQHLVLAGREEGCLEPQRPGFCREASSSPGGGAAGSPAPAATVSAAEQAPGGASTSVVVDCPPWQPSGTSGRRRSATATSGPHAGSTSKDQANKLLGSPPGCAAPARLPVRPLGEKQPLQPLQPTAHAAAAIPCVPLPAQQQPRQPAGSVAPVQPTTPAQPEEQRPGSCQGMPGRHPAAQQSPQALGGCSSSLGGPSDARQVAPTSPPPAAPTGSREAVQALLQVLLPREAPAGKAGKLPDAATRAARSARPQPKHPPVLPAASRQLQHGQHGQQAKQAQQQVVENGGTAPVSKAWHAEHGQQVQQHVLELGGAAQAQHAERRQPTQHSAPPICNGTRPCSATPAVASVPNLNPAVAGGDVDSLVQGGLQAATSRPLSAAEEAQRAELQDTLCCPITQVLFQDPVVAADGYTYERSAITDWLRCRNTSPMTNTVLPDRKLTPNRQAKALIASLSPNVRAALA